MEYLEVSKVISSIAVAIMTILSRYIYTLLTRNGERMRIRSTSVELIDKVINDRDWKKKENRLIVEEAFEQLYSKPLNFYEIKTLIYSETPNAAFRTYLRYRPAIEFNENKTKFRYKKGKRPYWYLCAGKIKIPKTLIQGALKYFLFVLPASYVMTWLLADAGASLSTNNLIFLWFIDGLFWLLGIIFLIEGIKYQNSERDIIKNLGDKFQLSNLPR
ncbi:MAG TPA: hypothetical protein GX719_08170 [Gammaproteobacteria bacterium]|nr:hypothetical protein [Gammaproteobacteria bacterium]